jgi:hypothetical protein
LQGVKVKIPDDKGRYLSAPFSPAVRATYTERAVLAWLATRERGGEVWAQLEEGARCTGLHVRSVRRILEQLADPSREGGALVSRELLHRGARAPSGFAVSRSTSVVRLLVGAVLAPLVRLDVRRWFRAELQMETLHRVLLALIASHSNAAGFAWPSYARLAWLAGCSVRSVAGAVGQLCRQGWLVRSLVAPGAELPDRSVARSWRLVLQVVEPDVRASTAGRPCIDSRTSVHKSPLHGSGLNVGPPAPPPPSDPLAEALRAFSSICKTERIGADAAAVMAARLREGRTVADLATAARGVASVPWRMELAERRTVRAAFGTADKFAGFLERGRQLEPDAYVTPAQERAEALQRAAQRADEAKGQAHLRQLAKSLPGGLRSLIRR